MKKKSSYSIPKGARIFYSYPDALIITIYGSVGNLLDTVKVNNKESFTLLERHLINELITPTAPVLSKGKLSMKIKQYTLSWLFLKNWTYEEIMESDFSYDSIKKRMRLDNYHAGYYWIIEK